MEEVQTQENTELVETPSFNDIIDKSVDNLNNNKFKVFLYCPAMNSPSGGIGVLLRFARHLKDEGYDTNIIYEPVQDQPASYQASVKKNEQVYIFQKFNPTWLDFNYSDIKFIPLGDKEIEFNDGSKEKCEPLIVQAEDFLIIPEGYPDLMKKTAQTSCKRIVLAQSWFYILNAMMPGEKWQHYGIQDVISVSNSITEYLNSIMPGLKIKGIKQGINRKIFKQPENTTEKMPMVVFSANRGQESNMKAHNIIKNFYAFYPHLKWIRFMELGGLSREDFAERVKTAAFALYTDDIAGFGTLPLEAMACGTHVVGYASFGGKEYMTPNNGFWCNNGDIFQTAEILGLAIDRWLSGEMDIKDVQEEYERTLSNYTEEGEKEQLLNIINQYKNERINELNSLKK